MELEELKTIMFDHPALKIPKEVEKAIERESTGYGIRYVGWLMEEYDGDVILRVFAHKTTKKYGLEVRETIRTILGKDGIIYRDMYFGCCSGWKVVFRPGNHSCSNWYGYNYYAYDEADFGKWYEDDDIGVAINIINLDMLKDTKFKYSGYNGKSTLVKWMRVYAKYPQVELLGKLGYEPSVKLLKKCAKDKAFCKFLAKNPHRDQNINAIIYAYNHNVGVITAGLILTGRADAMKYFKGCGAVKALDVDIMKIRDYCVTNDLKPRSYCDYIEACVYLGLDMKDTKNLFPKDFQRMHDTRIYQYQSKKDKTKLREFKKACQEYVKFETEDKIYTVLIPRTKKDLIQEGSALHHCVGEMGYDKKMIAKESFIAFVRKTEDKETPFVTVEYGLKEKAVLQCYGEYDSNPSKDVIKFVNKWSKGVKKAL